MEKEKEEKATVLLCSEMRDCQKKGKRKLDDDVLTGRTKPSCLYENLHEKPFFSEDWKTPVLTFDPLAETSKPNKPASVQRRVQAMPRPAWRPERLYSRRASHRIQGGGEA